MSVVLTENLHLFVGQIKSIIFEIVWCVPYPCYQFELIIDLEYCLIIYCM